MDGAFFKKYLLALLCAGIFSPVFAAPKEESVTLSTQDNWNLAALYMPANGKQTALVLLHDLGKQKEDFTSFKKALAKEGIAYLAIDLRGHGQSTTNGTYKTFAKEGMDNPFNKMTYDVQTAVDFLQKKGFTQDQIFLLGTGLGANVAAKTAGVLPDIGGLALISPNVNIRDVLSIPSLKIYKRDVLIAASAADRKGFLEASILRNIAFLSTGEGRVTFLTAYDFTGHELLDKYITQSVLQWVKTPHKPDIVPGTELSLQESSSPEESSGGLIPSVLAE